MCTCITYMRSGLTKSDWCEVHFASSPHVIRESVDSLCRDGADVQYT